MGVRTDVAGATNEVLQEAISAYSDEAYTNARKLSGTGIVGTNEKIDRNTETFIGQVRWDKPLNPAINVASLTDNSDGTKTTTSTDYLRYVKTVRTHGAEKVNMKEVVTQRDGLAKIGRDFGETRAQDEHNALLSVLKGVAISEAINGAAAGSGATGLGGQTFENDPTDSKYGFYVDLGASIKPILAYDNTKASMEQGAQRAEAFLQALGKGWKDYELPYYYLITSPSMMASFRSANLVDQDRVRDGNVDFQTIFDGKFRLISTRATQSLSAAEMTKLNTGAGVDIGGTKISFIVAPGAVAMEPLNVPVPTEIDRDASAYQGGGTTEIWSRWGYILLPAGYSWIGSEDEFPSDVKYQYAVEGGTAKALTSVGSGTLASTTGTFDRKFTSALSLGILPIFHG
jgi:hypothetical protein